MFVLYTLNTKQFRHNAIVIALYLKYLDILYLTKQAKRARCSCIFNSIKNHVSTYYTLLYSYKKLDQVLV